ncbi:MAG: MurR/RpiR family transcriptional regulator [Oscillospiraceae bacterium]|nr:MurR/RpiR family transcriptional regulator [Oscillospiraceae bacterium]
MVFVNIDLFSQIKNKLPEMSKGHKSIAGYILEHYDKAAFMTAAKLGATVGVSESTVVRMATELGFDGYPALQRALQDVMRNKLTAVQRIDVTSDQIGDSDIMEKVLNLDIERIRKTLEESSKEDFNSCVDKIMNSKTIYIIGARSSASLATFIKYYFNLIFPNVKLVTASTASEMFEQILRIDHNDVIIGISFPRYSNQTVTALRYAKTHGAKVIAITDSKSSPLVPYSDNVLIARSDMASFVDSLVAPLSLINALIVAVSIRARDRVTETFEKLETIWDEYEVYSKTNDTDKE